MQNMRRTSLTTHEMPLDTHQRRRHYSFQRGAQSHASVSDAVVRRSEALRAWKARRHQVCLRDVISTRLKVWSTRRYDVNVVRTLQIASRPPLWKG